MKFARPFIAATIAAALTIGMVAPASAAPHKNVAYNNGSALRAQITQLDHKIDRAESRRAITHREATQLDRQVDRLESTWRSYARNGFTRSEINTLNKRIGTVENALNKATRSHNSKTARHDDSRRNDYRR